MEKSLLDWITINWPMLVTYGTLVAAYMRYVRTYQRLVLKHEKITSYLLKKHLKNHKDAEGTEEIVAMLNTLE